MLRNNAWMRSGLLPCVGLLAAAGLILVDAPGELPEARAQPGMTCRVVELEMTPTADLQIVAWVEDRAGNYVDTAFITRTTGSYGLGNRPGIMEFNSGPWWPYGRRVSTFPVWAGRHGMSWPLVLFQDGVENELSHSLSESSRARFYCRPIKPDEALWDATSCASTVYSDKGVLSDDTSASSKYPPRSDITFDPSKDDPSVESMAALNPFDSVSHATPRGDELFSATWPVPSGVPAGYYVLWLEVSREFDQNDTYSAEVYPSPEVQWSVYGAPYRGQPSVLYKVYFTLTDDRTVATTLDYVGYGDPEGLDSEIRAPDSTITADVPGSGSSRLLVTTDIDDSTFDQATPGEFQAELVAGGEKQSLVVNDLLPRTSYSIGLRAFDECGNIGPLRAFKVITPRAESGTVDACFVATAAYGSLMAGEVAALRGFRDLALRTHVAGELAVEGYYTFGPLLARVIAPSDTLRRAARAALAPLVNDVRAAGF